MKLGIIRGMVSGVEPRVEGGKMPIQSIEIICLPCPKCKDLESRIRGMIKNIEMINRIKILFEFRQHINLKEISKYALNPSQTPAIIINGKVEFAGRADPILLRRRLEEIHKTY